MSQEQRGRQGKGIRREGAREREEGWEGEQRRDKKDTHFFCVSSFPAIRSVLGDKSHNMGFGVLLTFFPRISQQREKTRRNKQKEFKRTFDIHINQRKEKKYIEVRSQTKEK